MTNRFCRHVYLAVGRTHTKLYTFDPLDGTIRKTDVPAYEHGYDAMGYRWTEGLLYAVSQKPSNDTMVIIDPRNGTLTERRIEKMPRQSDSYTLGTIDPDCRSYIISGGASSASVEIDLSTDPIQVTALNAPGPGGWYDWAYHPVDRRLYAVDGDNGALLYMDAKRDRLGVILRKDVFPKAEGIGSGRKSYSAVFFEESGRLYAIDNAGNVNRLDLCASTLERPISAERVPRAERVGGGKIPVGELDIRDAAGEWMKTEAQPEYVGLRVAQEKRGEWRDGGKKIHSFRLSLTAGENDVRRWRVSFDLPDGAQVKTDAARMVLSRDGRVVLDTPGNDHVIRGGTTLAVDLQVANVPSEEFDGARLRNLKAFRRTSS